MDRSLHGRYLVYLKKYEYFGRGRRRLDAAEFGALDAEVARTRADDPANAARLSELRLLLLRD